MSPRRSDPTTRVKLLAAAEGVFVARGLERAKVEEITGRAGTSKGAFYLHFTSKEDAFRELVENMLARLASFLEDCIAQQLEATSLNEFLDSCVSHDVQIFDFIWQNRGLCSLLLGGGSSAGYRHLVDQFADRAAAQTRVMLERGCERGLYRGDLDLDVASDFISGAYDLLARRLVRAERKPDLEPLVRKVQSLVLYGIADASLAAAEGRVVPATTRKVTTNGHRDGHNGQPPGQRTGQMTARTPAGAKRKIPGRRRRGPRA
jgi:AcrR family transcriptional regulator